MVLMGKQRYNVLWEMKGGHWAFFFTWFWLGFRYPYTRKSGFKSHNGGLFSAHIQSSLRLNADHAYLDRYTSLR